MLNQINLRKFSSLIQLILLGFVSTSVAENHEQQPSGHWDRWASANPTWVESIEPFNIIGNVYYVGTKGLASFLLTSDKGHILIDGGLPQNAQTIIASIGRLGFDIKDVGIVLNSHAHFDHSGGLAQLKKESGAILIASEGDRSALETGFYPGSTDLNYTAPAVKVDRVVADGEVIQQSDIKLTANITPGHTPGCTSWVADVQDDEASYNVLFFCSATVAGNRLVGPPQYPGIVDDYRRTFAITKDWRPDVFLANHPSFFDLVAKRKRQIDGERLAFFDQKGFSKVMSKLAADFENELRKQKLKFEGKN